MPDKSRFQKTLDTYTPSQRIAIELAATGGGEDVFSGRKPVPGLEHLGRAIVDVNGVASGSPANFEATRGLTDPSSVIGEGEVVDPIELDTKTLAALLKEFPA